MAINVIMPKQGLQMVEGTITRWILKEGDSVDEGQPLLEIETDKATMEIQAPATGILLKIVRQEGELVPVAETIAVIGETGEDVSALMKESPVEPSIPVPVEQSRVFITPRAKNRAKEEAVDINNITGTGPDELIIENDVLKAAAIAQANHKIEVDFSEVEKLRDRLKSTYLSISYTDILIKITAMALKQNPIVKNIDISVAIAQDQGFVFPVIENVDSLSLKQISERLRELTQKAKSCCLEASEMPGGTFTIMNLGMFDIDSSTVVINSRASAILDIGKISKKPYCDEGLIVSRPVVTLSLTYDSGIIGSLPAAEFMLFLKNLVKNPYLILLN